MATLPSQRPSNTTLNTYACALATGSWGATTDDPDSPDDANAMTMYTFSSGIDAIFGGETTPEIPADFSAMTNITLRTRWAIAGWSDDGLIVSVGIGDPTGVFMLCDYVTVLTNAGRTIATSDYSLPPNATGLAAGKAGWDGLMILYRVRRTTSMGADSVNMIIYAQEVNGIYTPTVSSKAPKPSERIRPYRHLLTR